MTQEEKQLLLQDLSARLPYKVQVEIQGFHSGVLRGIDNGTVSTDRGINYPLMLVKPYLRPMSSMTEEERDDFKSTEYEETITQYPCSAAPTEIKVLSYTAKTFDWLNANHFDYRGLIEKGLALEAPANMYK